MIKAAGVHRAIQTAARRIERGAVIRGGSTGADRGTQLQLLLAYRQMTGKLPELVETEFRNLSQNGEDGILLYLFSLDGMGHRRAVEICAGDAIECNSANLVLHHGWDALLVDGRAGLLARGRAFYANHSETFRIGPTIVNAWVTRAAVNELTAQHGYDHDIDLLSVDMDGIDYWVLEAIDLRPRVIVVEYNNRIPASECATVPYGEEFEAEGGAWAGDGFFGASLAAFNKLLSGRGYRLIGANRQNTNAFFAFDGAIEQLPTASVESCLSSRWARHQQKDWPALSARAWVRV
jgi:hypothetical protein